MPRGQPCPRPRPSSPVARQGPGAATALARTAAGTERGGWALSGAIQRCASQRDRREPASGVPTAPRPRRHRRRGSAPAWSGRRPRPDRPRSGLPGPPPGRSGRPAGRARPRQPPPLLARPWRRTPGATPGPSAPRWRRCGRAPGTGTPPGLRLCPGRRPGASPALPQTPAETPKVETSLASRGCPWCPRSPARNPSCL